MDNPWGDPPLVHAPVERIAVWALIVSLLPWGLAALALVMPADERGRPIYGEDVAALLSFHKLALTPAGLVLGYVSLFTCPIDGLRSGRGLAWAALGLSYASILWYALISAALFPVFWLAPLVVLLLGMLHAFAFAAESSFARNAVISCVIGGMLLSLLSCTLVQSIEDARRLQFSNFLRQHAANLPAPGKFQIQRSYRPPANEQKPRE